MNRRSFLKKLGIGAGAATAAAATPELCHSLCSFWCTEHAAPVVATIGEYSDYANFSSLPVDTALDPIVTKAAEELGRQAGLSMTQVWRTAYDQPAAFGRA